MFVWLKFCIVYVCLLCQLNLCVCNNPETHSFVSTHTQQSTQQSLEYKSLLPDCNQEKVEQTLHKELLIISTLDGVLSALDVKSDGDLIWSKPISSEPLLSSTISNFELTKKGQIVRIVPSLDGNLYLYNGKTIDGIPLNAETLLRSSYKLGDDLVITGGQESKILGINILTGDVYYECGVRGCPASQVNENETFDDLLLVKRITQTVRAIEPRTGKEKWFFSVSEPQLSITPLTQCHNNYDSNRIYDKTEPNHKKIVEAKETDFKVIVPNGIISGKRYLENSENSDTIEWQYKFESPIVHVWHYKSGGLNALNLFDKQKLFGFTDIEFDTNILEPSIYIGRYHHQWYVQPSNKVKDHISQIKIQNDLLVAETSQPNSKSPVLQIEWKPQALIYNDEKSSDQDNGVELVSRPQFSLQYSPLNEDSLGYYILDVVDENETKCFINQSDDHSNEDWDYEKCDDEENGIIQQIVIASLWHYWREVTAISIFFAFLLNLFYSCMKRKLRLKCKTIDCEESSATNSPTVSTPVSPIQDITPSTPSFSTPFNQLNGGDYNYFTSRYLADFEPIQVLGKGGFGLVFEAKHIIDESHYAVKRICLPCKKEQRDKVMREVRALSKLDHNGIVRYYNAWVELPPPGWIENVDKQWNNEDISEAHFNDLYQESKQVRNQSHASLYQISTNFHSKQTHSEPAFSFNNSKRMSFSQTESSQSFDIVFDENVSSIKVLETNGHSFSPLDSGFAHNKSFSPCNSNSNVCESNLNSAQSKAIEPLTELKSLSIRPNSFNPPLPPCYLYIQMQLCRKDTLKDWLFNNACNRDIDVVLDIFNQIVSAVHYVHSVGLMHRDLKPSNIFFSMNGSIKIGDFGLVTATAIDEETHTPALNDDCFEENSYSILSQDSNTHTNKVGTQLYMSPEQIKNAPYSHKVDIFSMGIILFELLMPIKTEMERNVLLNNARKQIFPIDFCKNFNLECKLLKQLLSHNPEKRPSTAEIKEHELLKSFQSKTDTEILERRRTISQSNGCDSL